MVQDAKIPRPNWACFLELHRLSGLTWAGQNETEEPVRIQGPMYRPTCAGGYFDGRIRPGVCETITSHYFPPSVILIKIYARWSLKNISCAIKISQYILEAVNPFYRWGRRGWELFPSQMLPGKLQSYNLMPTLSGSKAHKVSTSSGSLPIRSFSALFSWAHLISVYFFSLTMASSPPLHVLPILQNTAISEQTWKGLNQFKFCRCPGCVNW